MSEILCRKARDENQLSEVLNHYSRFWGNKPRELRWNHGPVDQLSKDFRVLEFSPSSVRTMWTYATCGMSLPYSDQAIELHLFSPIQANELVELLTVTAHFHSFGAQLATGHTVNFGRPWLSGSKCTFGLISLPYLDGRDLEVMRTLDGYIRFLWLVPVTAFEVEYKKEHGLDALEKLFEARSFNYCDPQRKDATALD